MSRFAREVKLRVRTETTNVNTVGRVVHGRLGYKRLRNGDGPESGRDTSLNRPSQVATTAARSGIRVPFAALLFVGGALVASACGASESSLAAPTGSPLATEDRGVTASHVLLLDFDELVDGALTADTQVRDVSTEMNSAVFVTAENSVSEPPRVTTDLVRASQVLEFARCDQPLECVPGILEVSSDGTLNPGSSDFVYGSSVKMQQGAGAAGANVMQKGYSTDGQGQWKLQVDGEEGRPSCVIVGSDEGPTIKVTSDRSITDGEWHDVSCHWRRGSLTIKIDGVAAGYEVAGQKISVENEAPVRIGGKNLKPGGDFFFGSLDDVFVERPQD